MSAKPKRLAVTLTMIAILLSFTLANIKTGASSDATRTIDLFTQKMPFNGKGMNQSSDAFQPQELVMLYALITYNECPLANMLVAFQVNNFANALRNITVVGVSPTNQSGIAQFSFRIPWPFEDAEQMIFGEWFAIATVDIAGQVVVDTLKFQVGWIIKITNIKTLNANFEPQTNYLREETISFNLTIKNIALTPKLATIIIDAQDVIRYPIINLEIDNMVFQPGENHLCVSSRIPIIASIGEATVAATAYTASPKIGGAPYSPAAISKFEIVFSLVKQYHLTVRTDPPGVTTILGEGWYDQGENVTLAASLVEGYDFRYWDVDGVSRGMGINITIVHMDGPHVATAHYSLRIGGWYVPEWFYWFLLLLLLLIIILLVAWFYRRRRKRKAEESFNKGWAAWYYCYDLRGKVRKI